MSSSVECENCYNFKYIKPKMIDNYMLKKNWINDKLMQVNLQG